jgi:hypothetical protein
MSFLSISFQVLHLSFFVLSLFTSFTRLISFLILPIRSLH